MIAAISLVLLVLTFLAVEAAVLSRARSAVPIRIHVSGTRGKSTVVRLIVAGLRSAGVRTLGKVTGDAPTVLHPDQGEIPLRRRGAARVQEQVRAIAAARRLRCDALVLECMSVDPRLQRVEVHMLRPVVSVLTNTMADHQEIFGMHPDRHLIAAAALERSVPEVITTSSEAAWFGFGHDVPPLRTVTPADTRLDDEFGESPPGLAVNVALALEACVRAGVPEDRAMEGIHGAARAMVPRSVAWEQAAVRRRFIDGFSANDVRSAASLLDRVVRDRREGESLFIVLNTRADRPLRTRAFASWLSRRADIDGFIIAGTHREYCRRALVRGARSAPAPAMWSAGSGQTLPALCEKVSAGPSTFVGMMNAGGEGAKIREAFIHISQAHGGLHGH